MEERWLPCNNEAILDYEVSDAGRIRNPRNGRVLKTRVNEKGYEVVSIRKSNIRVHKLVADTFIEGDHKGLDVAHKDRNRLNNRADNLEFRTRSENIRNTYFNGREQTHRMRPIRCVETGEEWPSIEECSRATGLNRHSICKCVNNHSTKVRDGRHFEAIE